MDFGKLRTGELVAGIAGLLLLFVMFFSWYGPEGAEGGLNAWESFTLIDILLFLTGVAAVGLAVLAATGRSVALPVAASVIVTVAGIIATILVLYRLINEPSFEVFGGIEVPDRLIDIKIGAYLGLLLTAAVAAGGFMAMADEGTSLGDAARRAQGGGTPGPTTGGPGSPAPAAGTTPPAPPAPPQAGPPPASGPPAGGPQPGTEPPPTTPGGPPTQG